MGQSWHKARAEGSLEGSNSAHSSEYFSARIQEMIESRGEYATAVDSEIKESEVHWSELPEMAESDKQRSAEADKAFFESLRQQYDEGGEIVVGNGNFFNYMSELGWELGEKIAEGAQGVIYGLKDSDRWVVKVFKTEAGSLEALHKQWPPGMLKAIQNSHLDMFHSAGSCALVEGVMLEDGRFGFMMGKYWGDLRKMIDERMMLNGNQASPFGETRGYDTWGFEFMYQIALGMLGLHRTGVVHRDLKASNVLIQPIVDTQQHEPGEGDWFDPLNNSFTCHVADFESSAMTIGTTFWRAPEILNAVKNRSFEPNVCTEKSDVYSFGMTCYELATGKIPFEGVPSSNYDIVLRGQRPELPSGTCLWIGSMIDRCWHHVPSERPSFEEIVKKMQFIRRTLSNGDDVLGLLRKRKF